MPLVALPASFQLKLPSFPSVLCIVSLPSSCDPAPQGGYAISWILVGPNCSEERLLFLHNFMIAYIL